MKPLLLALLFLSGRAALHAHPGAGIAVDEQGRIFITAGPNIVLLETNGAARIIVSDPQNKKFFQLHHIHRTPDAGWATASDMGNAIWRFTHDGTLTRFYPPPNDDRALLVGLGGDPFAIDREGNVYAVNSAQGRFTQILKVTPQGRIHTLAGGTWGLADGQGAEAKFGDLHSSSMLVLSNGVLLLTEDGRRVRRVTPDGTVATLAGGRESGFADGPGVIARFAGAHGLAMDREAHILVAEYGESGTPGGRIRRIAPDGTVTTFAGTGRNRTVDGALREASFAGPSGLAIAANGDILVLEPDGPRVRKIANGQVTTLLNGLPK